MKIYNIIKALFITTGILLLTAAQAKPRANVLKKLDTKLKSLKLSAEELAFITRGNDAADLAVYELTGATNFKVGERIGYMGELNKAQAMHLQTAAAALAPAPAEKPASPPAPAEPDPELIALMAQVTPDMLNDKGTPDKAKVNELAGRKYKAADIEAAWAAHAAANPPTPAGAGADNDVPQDLIDAITGLDIEDDNNYDEDGATPKLEVIAGLVGREITAEQLQAALVAIELLPVTE